jgi:hypothetical protein
LVAGFRGATDLKKTIDRLLLAAGLVLAGSGAWWMWSGWDIVRDERGMAAFISGAVMLCGGLIVASVAWAVVRLLPGVPAAARPARLEETESFDAPEPAAGISPGAAGAAAAIAGAAVAAHAVADEKQEAAPDLDAPEGTTRFDEVASPVEIASASEPAEERPREPVFRRPSIEDLVRRSLADAAEPPPPTRPEPLFPRFEPFRDQPEPEAPRPEGSAEPEDVAEPIDEDGLSPVAPLGPIFPTARPRKEEAPTVEAFSEAFELPEKPFDVAPADDEARAETPAAEPAAETSDEGDWFDQAERSLERALGRTSPASEAEQMRAPETEPEAEARPPAVTGRYSSGDTHYTMYDDGSIEAQTPDGVMRFASLIELRRFVEQRA